MSINSSMIAMDPDDYMAVGSRGIGVVRENKNDYNDALGIAMMREQSPEGFELDEEHAPHVTGFDC